ncbi:ComEC/Rec2 family competence protein [Lacinutrix sp. Bg11-31]|uniref:ComEC/Rec2 family competence protein n=1 Tax=Lacinutrix sp. Bg11-31 TaxID=2057808 RepID=UPI000C30B710|nr:ComEC/Rec2 family competence protein [Lacinutrix sp. Bg11-31]AUC82439.1 competence protein [Lacinutrix sp. Bg11-31]
MKLLNFTIIKLTACLVLGILIAFFIAIPLPTILYATAFLLSLLTLLYFISKNKRTKTIWFGVASFLTMVCIGVLVTNFHDEKLDKKNYTNIDSAEKLITFRIRTTLKSGNYNDKYIVDILKIAGASVSGKALLNVSRDSLNEALKVDNIYITFEEFQPIVSTINPYQFNYRSYLEKQYVFKQLYVKPIRLFRVSDNKHTVFGYADLVRETINTKLKTYAFEPDVLAIINALILGQRQDLSKDIYDSYTDAGAVHILAVSGLHVALILLLLNFALKPLKRFKYGKEITIIILVVLMWSFAIIAGLSASVTRAVTMFSIIAVGMHLRRPTNIYNTLAISIFVLLLFKPLFLFDVGFQLSYLAVVAIVAIQPRLVKLWQPKNFFLSKAWDYFTVGIAAQFGVVPISLYYFHQFPGLFFVANIIIIPFLGFILGIGILVIILALCNALPKFLVDGFGFLISGMNDLMKWLSLQESFLFKDISFNGWQVIAAYLFAIAFVQLGIKKNYKWLKLTLVSVLLFQGVNVYTKYNNSTETLTFFHKNRYTVIGQKKQDKLNVFSSLDSLSQFSNLTDYTIGNTITEINTYKVPSFIKTKNNTVLIIDSLGIHKVKLLKPDFIFLTQSPRLNMDRLIDSLKPKQVIADGSNYKSYVARWRATCIKQKIPFHYTGEKGAFIIE